MSRILWWLLEFGEIWLFPGLLAWESGGTLSERRRTMAIVVFSSWVKLLENLVLGDGMCVSKFVIKNHVQNAQHYITLTRYQDQQMDNIIIIIV